MNAELTAEFTKQAGVFRQELLAFCYRMLGSADDAEEVVQETYLSAWRSYDTFEGRSSLRTWLYRIAARACLKALENARRRPLPSGIAGPGSDPDTLVTTDAEITWLQPVPHRSSQHRRNALHHAARPRRRVPAPAAPPTGGAHPARRA